MDLHELSQPVDDTQEHHNSLSMSATERSTIDLTDNLIDDSDDSAPVQQHLPEGSVEELSYREIIRTDGENSTLRFNLDRLSSTWSRLRSASKPLSTFPPTPSDSQTLHATANVANADDAEGAERELTRVVQKEDFSSMHVLGQFNLGFIITRRVTLNEGEEGHGADDLFIVDQHAADEKYNFETLQQTTKIESQKLFQPRCLELTVADELVAIENVEVLRSNGFEVVINDDAPTGHGERVRLVALPVSKSTTFTVKGMKNTIYHLSSGLTNMPSKTWRSSCT